MADPPRDLSRDRLLEMMRTMLRIRRFEETLAHLFKRGKLPGFIHLYIGEEAVAVGTCAALTERDRITSTHRGHGHVIAKGGEIRLMMAELLGRRDGYCRGKGGSMHIVDFGLGIMGTNGIVGGGIPIAVGSAWGDTHLSRDAVTACFFGDGAANQGVFLEGMNLAAMWRLPVLFVCENNQYTEWTPTKRLTAGRIANRSAPLGIPGEQVDGNDVLAMFSAVDAAVARARSGQGPSLIEAVTYRWHGHNEGEEAFSGSYRPSEEIAEWKSRDPIEQFRARLREWELIDDETFERINHDEVTRVEEALEFAEAAAPPDPEEALERLFPNDLRAPNLVGEV